MAAHTLIGPAALIGARSRLVVVRSRRARDSGAPLAPTLRGRVRAVMRLPDTVRAVVRLPDRRTVRS